VREVLLRRVQDLKEEAELLMPSTLLIQVLIRSCELQPVASVILLDFVHLEQRLNLLENAQAKFLTLLALEVEFEFLRRIFVLLVLLGGLLEVEIIEVTMNISEAPERVGLLEFCDRKGALLGILGLLFHSRGVLFAH
jgi:hypothetical protein